MPHPEHHGNMSRMSNTAEILTKQFREAVQKRNLSHMEGANTGWQWKRFKDEMLNFFVQQSESIDLSASEEVNELFPKYRMRLQNNFFVSLLMLNILFNGIVIIVALVEKVCLGQSECRMIAR